MLRIAHLINPVKVHEDSDFYKVQQKTFEAILNAKKYSSGSIEIALYTIGFEEDIEVAPIEFKNIGLLQRSVLDVNSALKGKKLPLFQDVLDLTLPQLGQFDLLIYTNMDILPLPYFYEQIAEKYKVGHDAIVINRRRISLTLLGEDTLTNSFAQIGRSHPGFDTFAISPKILQKMNFAQICLGVSFFEVSFVHQIAAFAQRPCWLLDQHLTLHYGLEVLVKRNNAYYRHNRSQYEQIILPQIRKYLHLSKFPYAQFRVWQRTLNWGLNPSIFFKEFIELQSKSWKEKAIHYLQEWRWRLLQR